MIRLITGTPRSGKTLWAMEQLFKVLDETELRPIYCDIKGLNHQAIKPVPDDWRTCPDGSLIIMDEVQYRDAWSRRSKGDNRQILDLTTHGHRKIDIWIITQSPRYLNADVLGLVGEHVHVKNALNSKHNSKIYIWREAQTTVTRTAMLLAEDSYGWRYPKHLFNDYVSAEAGHNKKTYIPKKVVSVVISLLVGLFLLVYVLNKSNVSVNAMSKPAETAAIPVRSDKTFSVTTTEKGGQVYDSLTPEQRADLEARSPVAPDFTQNQVNQIKYDPNQPFSNQFDNAQAASNQPYLSGCMQLKNKCSCFTQQGSKLDVSIADCKKIIGGDMPYNPFLTRTGEAVQSSVPNI